MADSCKIN